MTPNAIEDRPHARPREASIQTYARIAGVLFLVSFVAGGFGEAYVPARLVVATDATATANNIVASEWLLRLGFASYLVEAVCDVVLALVLYVLLEPAGPRLALLAVLFRLVATAVFAVAELFFFAPTLILRGADYLNAFTPDQLNALALLSLETYKLGAGLFMVFYGIPCVLFGYLIYRSGYLPRVLGALFAVAGLGFAVSSFVLVLAPAYASPVLFLPMIVAGLALTTWLLVRGVDVPKWEASAGREGVAPAP
jgi:hypothetical protein